MTKVAVSGGSGYVGRFIVDRLLADGHDVVVLGRQAPAKNLYLAPVEYRYNSLANLAVFSAVFADCEVFVHAAFHHKGGKYRGGEGDDPIGFRRKNHDGSMALFRAAKKAGVQRAIFLSSRAVYGVQAPGLVLSEDTEPSPDTLYGQVKLETEHTLANLEDIDFLPIILRVTGVYGASAGLAQHKWASLFEEFENGVNISPHIGTEVHGEDMAQAVGLLLTAKRSDIHESRTFNVSDILLDRRELLRAFAERRGLDEHRLPLASNPNSFNRMDCARLRNLGWRPRGALDLDFL